MDWGWLKILLEKLRIYSIIGSGVFVALCAIFISQDLWILIFTGLLSFLIIEFIIYLFGVFKKKQKIKRRNLQEKHKQEMDQEKINNSIWYLFLGLSDVNMKLVLAIFDAPGDYTNKYVRVIKQCDSLYSQLESISYLGYGLSDPFAVPINNSEWVFDCLHREHIGDSIKVSFVPYFYSLVEEYLKTGLKKKI